MQTAKTKVKVAVEEYKRIFPLEYEQFKSQNAVTVHKQKNKYGALEGDHAIERHLYDLPEKLHQTIYQTLNAEELQWFTATGSYIGKFEGVSWFIKNFPIFKTTNAY